MMESYRIFCKNCGFEAFTSELSLKDFRDIDGCPNGDMAVEVFHG